MPVSTTHALTGALVGAGLGAAWGEVRFSELGKSFVLPLLCSPLIALILTILFYPLFRLMRRTFAVTSASCICLGTKYEEVVKQPDGTLMLVSTGLALEVGQAKECYERYKGQMLGVEAGPVLDGFHYLSAGAVGFARGLNDTPKIVGLLVAGLPSHLARLRLASDWD